MAWRQEDVADMAWLVPRCLVIVLNRNRQDAGEDTSPPEKLFESFQEENGQCHWNPHLEESIKHCRYVGCLDPCSLLITARDIYLDTIKGAWSRRVLLAPVSWSIVKVGELPQVEMLVHPQTQFTPLPEALCLIISGLCREGLHAELDAIRGRLAKKYEGIQQPSEHIIYETLECLLKERKIYHTGHSYKIVTPETFALLEKGYLKEHPAPIFLPLPVPSKTACSEMRSISCQTANIDEGDSSTLSESQDQQVAESKSEKKARKSLLDRSNSVRVPKKDKKAKEDTLGRSNSLRYNEEKAAAVLSELNLKETDVIQTKEKAEKSSMLKKIFGRNKNHKSALSKVEESAVPASGTEQTEKKEVEYATFSAQFPPTDWTWYDQQVQVLLQQQYDSGALCPKHHAGLIKQQQEAIKQVKVHGWPPGQENQPPSPNDLPRPRSASSQSHHSQSSEQETPVKELQGPARTQLRSSSRSRKHRKAASQALHSYLETDLDSHLGSHLDSTRLSNIYNEPECVPDSPGIPSQIPPALPNRQDFQEHIYMNVSNVRHKNLGRQFASICGNDISIQYHGRMPRKNSSYSMSRDSGVNCIGLSEKDRTGGPDRLATTPNNKIREKNHDLSLQQDSGFSSPRTDTEYNSFNNNLPHKNNSLEERYKSCLSITGSQFYPAYNPSSKFSSPIREVPSSTTSSQQTVLEANNNRGQHRADVEHRLHRRRRQKESELGSKGLRDSVKESRESHRESHKDSFRDSLRDSMVLSNRHSSSLRHSYIRHGSDSQESRLDFLKDCKVVGIV